MRDDSPTPIELLMELDRAYDQLDEVISGLREYGYLGAAQDISYHARRAYEIADELLTALVDE